MPYRFPNPAMKAGSWARNHATAPLRAMLTLWWSDAGRIGNSAAKSSSETSLTAISRRNLSPFFGPAVATKDCIATLNNTASADGGGNSLAAGCGSFTDNNPTTHATARPATVTGYGEPWGNVLTDRVTPPKHAKLHHTSRLKGEFPRRNVTRFRGCAQGGVKAFDGQRRVSE